MDKVKKLFELNEMQKQSKFVDKSFNKELQRTTVSRSFSLPPAKGWTRMERLPEAEQWCHQKKIELL